jgi:predicted dehydrogenase
MAKSTRRIFLQQSLAAGTLFTLSGRRAVAESPNEQINLGVIGLGGRGKKLLGAFDELPGVAIAGLCDPDSDLRDKYTTVFPDAKAYADMRELLDSSDIDAVVIAACNHWHCLAAQWALDAGKHVYVEKPLCNAHWEGQQIVRAAADSNKICQIGTQQRSSPMQTEIKRLLHEEKAIGDIEWVRVNRFGVRASIGKRDTPLEIPKTVDYNLWLGPATDQPIYRDKLHYDWHWDWNTGGGEMGNWGVHILDDVRNNVFQDRIPFPKRVVAAGGRFGWNDAGNTPNTHFALIDTGEVPVVIALTNLPAKPASAEDQETDPKAKPQPPHCPGPSSGYVVYCEGGRLEGQRGHAKLFDSAGTLIKDMPDVDGMGLHQQNFLDAIRSGQQSDLIAPVENGHHSTAWCNLANYAYRVAHEEPQTESKSWESVLAPMNIKGITAKQTQEISDALTAVASLHEPESSSVRLQAGPVLEFDSKSETFVGDHAESANRHLRTTGRGPFAVKEVARTMS